MAAARDRPREIADRDSREIGTVGGWSRRAPHADGRFCPARSRQLRRQSRLAPGAQVSAAEFRHAMGHFATGVTIVTPLGADGSPVGTTASAVTSLSLDPPLVLVCFDLAAGRCGRSAGTARSR